MIKSLTALAIFALLGASVVALPGFAPQVEAREAVALAKADRLDIRPVVANCSQQVWPNFDASCLRGGDATVREARLVTARR
jgi:Mrp family chromosome partitioning ATPase